MWWTNEHPHSAAPEQAGEAGGRGCRRSRSRGRTARARPPSAQTRKVLSTGGRSGPRAGRARSVVGAALGVDEDPADVGVDEASQRTRPADAVIDMGAVRVARACRRRRGACGGRRPRRSPAPRSRPSRRPRTSPRSHRRGLEAPVGEQAVEADGNAGAGDHIEDREDDRSLAGAVPDQACQQAIPRPRKGPTVIDAGDDPVAGLVSTGWMSSGPACGLGAAAGRTSVLPSRERRYRASHKATYLSRTRIWY